MKDGARGSPRRRTRDPEQFPKVVILHRSVRMTINDPPHPDPPYTRNALSSDEIKPSDLFLHQELMADTWVD